MAAPWKVVLSSDEICAVCGWSIANITSIIEEPASIVDLQLQDGSPMIAINFGFLILCLRMIEEKNLPQKATLSSILASSIDMIECESSKIDSLVRSARRCEKRITSNLNKLSELLDIPPQLKPLSVGPLCQDLGITLEWLLDCDDTLDSKPLLTNGHIIELVAVKRNMGRTLDELSRWIARILALEKPINVNTLNTRIKGIFAQRNKISPNPEKLKSFLEKVYHGTVKQPPSLISLCTKTLKDMPKDSAPSTPVIYSKGFQIVFE